MFHVLYIGVQFWTPLKEFQLLRCVTICSCIAFDVYQVLGAGIVDGRSPWAFNPTKVVSLVRDIAAAVMQDNPNGNDTHGATSAATAEADKLVNNQPPAIVVFPCVKKKASVLSSWKPISHPPMPLY